MEMVQGELRAYIKYLQQAWHLSGLHLTLNCIYLFFKFLSDFEELQAGTDGTDPTDGADSDKDGVNDATEEAVGTDPNHPDSDKDGASDGEEAQKETDGLDPNDIPVVPDEDGEGVSDGLETIMDTDPTNPDTDGDGVR